jgi:hypothetical protein
MSPTYIFNKTIISNKTTVFLTKPMLPFPRPRAEIRNLVDQQRKEAFSRAAGLPSIPAISR